jgi:hypothetical protein
VKFLGFFRYFNWLREESSPFSPHGFGRPTGKDMAIDVPPPPAGGPRTGPLTGRFTPPVCKINRSRRNVWYRT